MLNFKKVEIDNFGTYLKNRNVAVVGPAGYLDKIQIGKQIDSYDIVVRVNRGSELIKNFSDKIGERTDVLYNCLIESPDNGGKLDVKFFKKMGIKWICTVPNSTKEGLSNSADLHPMVNEHSVKKIKKNFNFHIMNYLVYNKLNMQIKCRANTGFAAIFDLLNYEIKNLFVTGFSFYLDEFINGYKKGSERNEKEFALQCYNSKRHRQKPQWKYFKDVYNKSNVITVDPILENILKMNEFSRKNFKF